MHLSELEIPKRSITAMQKKHIHTVEDLLRWFPRKYRDYREIRDIMDCPDGEYAAVSGRLMKVQVKQGAKGAYLRYLEKKYTEEYLKRDVVASREF